MALPNSLRAGTGEFDPSQIDRTVKTIGERPVRDYFDLAVDALVEARGFPVFAYRRAKYQGGWLDRMVSHDLLRVIRELRRQRFDLAISMRRPYSNTNAWLVYTSGAPWRLGYFAPDSHPFGFDIVMSSAPGRNCNTTEALAG